jgi:cell wall-associated NlpC family hydrolase
MKEKILSVREQFVEAAVSRAGYPYRWGAQDGAHFDCSGLVLWSFAEIGRPMADTNAAGLYEKFHSNKIMTNAAPNGSLWFYSAKKDGAVSHVMIQIRTWDNGEKILIGARGGDSTTRNDKVAFLQNALVDVVSWKYWQSNFLFAVDPFLHE